ncbi:MAG: tRNA glutamyl-Q(34) synthetase GluQRS [Venatoribacter sp.]
MNKGSYVGRFAPTPTGPLHFGSLLAALASYLDAKHHQGQWLIRIEDLDPVREDPSASVQILHTLEEYGFEHDGEIRFQSQRSQAYQACLDRLIELGFAFPCQCSRTHLHGRPHHGNCQSNSTLNIAWRFLTGSGQYCFNDRIQGQHCEDLSSIGDFVLKRKDGPWAYQLAVVCDDIDQGVTHIVRGIDLLDSTARQALLYQALAAPLPRYAHIPVATENNGQKLSKQNLAKPLPLDNKAEVLFTAFTWLNQHPPAELKGSIKELLDWGIRHWNEHALHGLKSQPAPTLYIR